MICLAKKYSILSSPPELLRADEEKKILIFKRKNLIFAMNFNPVDSYADYGFQASPGKYVKVLDSDDERFNGFSRLAADSEHFTIDGVLSVYLPSRCALVLKYED